MYDIICAEGKGTAQIRRGKGAVHDQRRAGVLGAAGQRADVSQLEQRVGNNFDQYSRRVVLRHRLFDVFRVRRIDEVSGDTLLGQQCSQQVIGRTVTVACCDDMAAGAHACCQQRGVDRCHAGRCSKGRVATFQRRNGPLERLHRRAGVAAIDVAGRLAREDLFHNCGGRLKIPDAVIERRRD